MTYAAGLAIRRANRHVIAPSATTAPVTRLTMFVVTHVRQALQHAGTAGAASAYRPARDAARMRQNFSMPLQVYADELERQT